MKSYYVYRHMNKINGKSYIGMTCQQPERRWQKNGQGYNAKTQTKFFNAIQKYGWENFEHEILFSNLTFEEAVLKEKELIDYYDSFSNGYNSSLGGVGNLGHIVTENARQQMSVAHAGQVPWSKGKKLSSEHRRKLSLAHKGKNTGTRSENTRDKISTALKGKAKSRIARQHMSESAKGRVPWNKGKTGLAGHKKSVQERDKIAKANGIAIAMYDAESEAFITEFVSLSAACRYLREETSFKGANTTVLSRVINAQDFTKVVYGFKWKKKIKG